jgi:NAD(P)-dependent dehydrogenase (short-subunit alcohol dehydrogenase family)
VTRVAIVTGAGSGIGRAVCEALGRVGFTLVLAGRHADRLDATRAAISADAISVVCDVAVAASVDALFDTVEDRFGRLDLLVNNAGVGARAVPIEELSVEEWQRVVDTNLTGAFLCTRRAVAIMKRQTPRGGRIINNGSISAIVPRPLSTPYTATKHAISGLTKSTNLDGRSFDIACGQIDIGNAETPMTARMAQGVAQADGTTRPEPTIDVSIVAAAVAYMAGLPLDANVPFMTVMATRMPYAGRG